MEIIEYIKSTISLIGNRKTGYYYNSFYDFLDKEGQYFLSEKLTSQEEKSVNELVERFTFHYGFPKFRQCFYNSQLLLILDRSNQFVYCEGYAISKILGFPVLHGFLTINNKVVDITWKDSEGNFCIGDKSESYFGVKFNSEDIKQAICDTGMAQSHLENWWNKNGIFKKKFNQKNRYYGV